MKRFIPKSRVFRAVVLSCLLAAGFSLWSFAQKQPLSAKKEVTRGNAAAFEIKFAPVGPTEDDLAALNKMLPAQPGVAAFLQGSNFRHIHTELIEPDEKGARAQGTTHFRAIFYDYTQQHTVVAEGVFSNPTAAVARVEKTWQPLPSEEEFQDAVAALRTDPGVGGAINSGALAPYRPMPPVLEVNADGSTVAERIINVGLIPRSAKSSSRHEIVGVDLAGKRLVRYAGGAPESAKVDGAACGSASAGQASTNRGTAGQYQMTVTDGSETLWEMLIIRPSISSGTRGSGVEVRDVKFKGRSVLKRGHVPILNVQYDFDACGPYRDWQYQEGMFQTTGTNVPGAAGFRDCGTTPATTQAETGVDTGNFRGVAVYRQGDEVVLVSELDAGWYRYISEWRFSSNGNIRPRFGFGAVDSSCTCSPHIHHVYFRLDMDLDGPINSIYEIPNKKTSYLIRPDYLVANEKKVQRDANLPYFYRIRGGERSYVLYPGVNDGVADAYGRGDMWFLRYKTGTSPFQAEIDDGRNDTEFNTEANLDVFLTNETLGEQDSVIWYHAQLRHSPTMGSRMCMPVGFRAAPGPNILTGDLVVGPDLLSEDL
jgi:hypothetical protein